MTYTSSRRQASVSRLRCQSPQVTPFVQHSSKLLDQIFESCHYDLTCVNQLIDPILSAQKRCQLTSLYIHGVVINQYLLLATNLTHHQQITVLPSASNWLIGSSTNCSISVDHNQVDRCHAVVGYLPEIGFYIADVGSETGTYANRRLLTPLQRRSLQDGDLIELGQLRVEFFMDCFGQPSLGKDEDTCH